MKRLLLTLLISTSLIGTSQALTFVNSNSKDKPTSKVSTSDTKAFNELWESTKTKKIKVTKPWNYADNQGVNALYMGPRWTSHLRSMYNTDFPTRHTTADMNNDGILDFIYTPFFNVENLQGSGKIKNYSDDRDDKLHGRCVDEACRGEAALPSIYFGRSDGTWIYGTGAVIDNREDPGYMMADRAKVADFNGDGKPDIWLNETEATTLEFTTIHEGSKGRRDSYYLSQPDGTWLESSDTHLSHSNFQVFDHGYAFGDIDSDGDNDILITTSEGHSYCWVNNGKGYMKLDKNCARGISAFIVEFGDMDGDGDLDLISLHLEDYSKKWAGDTAIHYNNGKGRFSLNSVKLKEYGGKYDWNGGLSIKAADFDGDGDNDLILSRHRNPYVGLALEVKENLGNGKFGSNLRVIYDIPDYTIAKHSSIKHEGGTYNVSQMLLIADANNDGLPDIITYSGGSGGMRLSDYVYISNGDMTFTEIKKNDKNNPIKKIMAWNFNVKDRFYMEDMY
jgi:hypothetical protein